MPTISIALPTPHDAQRQVIREASRFNVVCCGRRWGKTTLGIDRLMIPALEGKPVAWFSPTYKMLVEVWRTLRFSLAPVARRINTQDLRIELLTGGTIDLWSLDRPDVARGRAYATVIVDEAAMIRDLREAWQAILRPTLADYRGGAWFLSTPKGMNYFYELFRIGQERRDGEWTSWRMPTSTNPYIDPREIEAARRSLSELYFAQEFLAEFIPDSAGVFRRVLDAATAEPQDAPVPGHVYVVSVDWGKHDDFTVIAVWDATLGHLVALDRSNRIDYALQEQRLRAICERFRPVALVPERNAMGEPIIERIARAPWAPPQILPFTTTHQSKTLAVEAFALALEQGAVKFLPHPDLISELQAYQATRMPSGMLRYGAPAGMHDDTVMAAIIGWWALVGGTAEPGYVIYDEHVSVSPV